VDEYEQFVKDNYSRTRSKMKKLLMDDIPEEFVTRQLNDSTSTSSTAKPEISAESVITYGAFDTPGFSIDTIEGASSKVPLTDLACNSLSPTEKQGEQ